MKQHWIIILGLIVIAFASCSKGDEELSPITSLTFISVSPTTAIQYTDSLTFVIGYEDGDGDLGSNDPDIKNLYLTDSRNGVVYEFRVKQLAPTNSTIAIKGTLSVVLDRVGLIGSGAAETATYSIYMTDRAGNQSNTITSSAVTIQQ
jgi:hypothetical protein